MIYLFIIEFDKSNWILIPIIIGLIYLFLFFYAERIRNNLKVDERAIIYRNEKIKNEFDLKLKENEVEFQKKITEITNRINEKSRLDLEKWKANELREHKEVMLNEAKAQLANWKVEMESQLREDAAKRSVGVKIGLVVEQLLPFSEYFRKFNPRDARFIGSPIDLIVFDGVTDNKDKVKIYFVEIKTGKNVLSESQQRVKEAVESKNIEWYPINATNFRW